MPGNELMFDSVWFDQSKYEEAEALGVLHRLGRQAKPFESMGATTQDEACSSPLINQIVKARENILQSLGGSEPRTTSCGSRTTDESSRISALEKENRDLRGLVEKLAGSVAQLEVRIKNLEGHGSSHPTTAAEPVAPKAEKKEEPADDDDDFDLFESDEEEDAEAERLKAERVEKYKAKKSKKPGPIAKSSIILDIKPWDDETDLDEIEKLVRGIEADGLLWGASKRVPVAYGIQKISINCVVEDEKIGTDFLEERITAFEDLVQSVDIAAFNKI